MSCCPNKIPLAIVRVYELLIEAEGLAAVLTWLVVNVFVSIIVHEAKPLQEWVQKQVEFVLTVTWIVAFDKLLVQIQVEVVVIRVIFVVWAVLLTLGRRGRLRIYILFFFFSRQKIVHRKVELEVPVPILGQALYAIRGVDRGRPAIYMFSILLFFLLALVSIWDHVIITATSRVNWEEKEHLYHESHLFLGKEKAYQEDVVPRELELIDRFIPEVKEHDEEYDSDCCVIPCHLVLISLQVPELHIFYIV